MNRLALRLTDSLHKKLSLVFFLLLFSLAAVQSTVFAFLSNTFADETDQILNWGIARQLADRLQPYLTPDIDYGGVQQRLLEISALAPHLDVYVVDAGGKIIAWAGEQTRIRKPVIDTKVLKQFVSDTTRAALPIYSTDPLQISRKVVFSAAKLDVAGTSGFLYVVLGNQRYDNLRSVVRGSYVAQGAAGWFTLSVLVAAVIGSLLFYLLTRRLITLTSIVERFRRGNLDERVGESTGDEIGKLGMAFNDMASTIVDNIRTLELTDANRREFVSNVSHDLRGPLGSVRGYLEALKEKGNELPEARRVQLLDSVTRNIDFLIALVDELFELSKLEARDSLPDLQRVAADELIEHLSTKYARLAAQSSIELKSEMPEGIPAIRADLTMLQRALSNLVENALAYTEAGGTVTLSLKNCDSALRFRISDTGIGIPADELPRIFERFYRASTGRSKKGTGLGLPIVKKILQAHGVEINVESRPGEGTSFWFDLPIADPGTQID